MRFYTAFRMTGEGFRMSGEIAIFVKDMGNKRELLKRVREMEARYDELARVLDELDDAVAAFERFGPELQKLRDYMESGQWKADFEADEAGLIPAGVKRGVLSEDGLYDLLLEADLAAEGVGKRFRG